MGFANDCLSKVIPREPATEESLRIQRRRKGRATRFETDSAPHQRDPSLELGMTRDCPWRYRGLQFA